MDDKLKLLRDKKSLQSIPYKIDSYSSFASSYYPSNILVNNPTDANSRWSTTTNDHRQFIILSFDPSTVSTIQFGKFSKIHVCNIKEMKISVSYDKENWTEVFYGGLKNDTRAETHNLQYYTTNSNLLISRYLKIEPLAAWGMNFNYSIWYIKLKGITNKNMDKIVEERQREKEISLLKKLLKKYPDVHPSTSIVEKYLNKGMYEDLEEYIKNLNPEIFDRYIDKSPYKGTWTEIPEEESWPCARGGHQMVALEKGIFMYGGWNGSEELGDTWIYDGKWINNRTDIHKNFTNTYTNTSENFIDTDIDILEKTNTKKMEIIDMGFTHHNIEVRSLNNEDISTPGKRSCHKMCTDGVNIYLIGKYIPNTEREESYKTEIWVYNGKWEILEVEGEVPSNMYDHYLVFKKDNTKKNSIKSDKYIRDITKSDITNDNITNSDNIKSGDNIKSDDIANDNIKSDNTNDNITKCEDNIDISRSHDIANCNIIKSEDNIDISKRDDITNDKIYMFGGKTTSYDDSFGGLYEIRLKDKLSIKLLDSNDQPCDSPFLRGRLGHVLHYLDLNSYPNTLAVVGGQRGKEYFKNISFYSLDTQTVYETVNFPIHTDGRVLQRSIIYGTDLIVLFTYGKDKESKLDLIKLWSYSLIYKEWKEIKTNNGPLARTAHQFVYWKDNFYLFGGNVIDTRQNDFWKLNLEKINREEVRRIAVMTVRKHKFLSMYEKNVERGLKYLRKEVRECVVDE